MVRTVKDRSQMDREDIFWRCERCFRVRRCCHRRYTPAHDENLNLAGSITREAESTTHIYARTEANSVRERRR